MSGVVEESSKVAQHAITALNSVPVLLALVMLQFFILGSVLYLSIQRDRNVHQRFIMMIERCTGLQGEPQPPQQPQRRSQNQSMLLEGARALNDGASNLQ